MKSMVHRVLASEVKASVPNKIKNSVMRTLTSGGATVDRRGDNEFVIHNKSGPEVVELLKEEGWIYDSLYKELTKKEEEYSLGLSSGGGSCKLEFIYDGDL